MRSSSFSSHDFLSLALAAALASTMSAHAATAQHKHRPAAAPTTRDTDTTSTGGIRPKAPEMAVPDPAAKDIGPLPAPFHLPTASRQRMRDCGLKWQAMKESGEAGEDIWRDFATRCLAASSGPFDKRSER